MSGPPTPPPTLGGFPRPPGAEGQIHWPLPRRHLGLQALGVLRRHSRAEAGVLRAGEEVKGRGYEQLPGQACGSHAGFGHPQPRRGLLESQGARGPETVAIHPITGYLPRVPSLEETGSSPQAGSLPPGVSTAASPPQRRPFQNGCHVQALSTVSPPLAPPRPAPQAPASSLVGSFYSLLHVPLWNISPPRPTQAGA